MKVLIIGSGGREHALAQALHASPLAEIIYVANGNAGYLFSELWPKLRPIQILPNDFLSLKNFAIDEAIALTIVGPDQALSDGIVDFFEEHHLPIFGPTKLSAKLEWSKGFAKSVMRESNVPTAFFHFFEKGTEARTFLQQQLIAGRDQAFVVKVDGLALGKGVVVTENMKEAITAVDDFLSGKTLGFVPRSILLEEKLSGPEVSFFYLCDGADAVYLAHASDYKRLLSDNKGPNTGGMGAITFPEWVSQSDKEYVKEKIVLPVLANMINRGTPFRGVLFVGLMKTAEGLKVLEFNTRFGDPETQGIMPMLDEDILPWLMAVAKKELSLQIAKTKRNEIKIKEGISLHLVLAADGYPGTEGVPVRKGDVISIDPDLIERIKNDKVKIFFAGVKEDKGDLVTNGGRVLGLTVIATDVISAREQLYQLVSKVNFEKKQYREDIGLSNQA